MADLDRYASPPRDAATLAARRDALLDQLGWLEDEAAALAPLLAALPAWATEQAPMPGDLTAKETFAAIAADDRDATPAWIARVLSEDAPEVEWPTHRGTGGTPPAGVPDPLAAPASDDGAAPTDGAALPEGDGAATSAGDGGANSRSLDDLLGDLRAARAALRQSFQAVLPEAWTRTLVLDGQPTDLYGLALAVVQRDADRLKNLAYRLHEADLSPRTPADDLPRPPSA